jgi:hypothetical protein
VASQGTQKGPAEISKGTRGHGKGQYLAPGSEPTGNTRPRPHVRRYFSATTPCPFLPAVPLFVADETIWSRPLIGDCRAPSGRSGPDTAMVFFLAAVAMPDGGLAARTTGALAALPPNLALACPTRGSAVQVARVLARQPCVGAPDREWGEPFRGFAWGQEPLPCLGGAPQGLGRKGSTRT